MFSFYNRTYRSISLSFPEWPHLNLESQPDQGRTDYHQTDLQSPVWTWKFHKIVPKKNDEVQVVAIGQDFLTVKLAYNWFGDIIEMVLVTLYKK